MSAEHRSEARGTLWETRLTLPSLESELGLETNFQTRVRKGRWRKRTVEMLGRHHLRQATTGNGTRDAS